MLLGVLARSLFFERERVLNQSDTIEYACTRSLTRLTWTTITSHDISHSWKQTSKQTGRKHIFVGTLYVIFSQEWVPNCYTIVWIILMHILWTKMRITSMFSMKIRTMLFSHAIVITSLWPIYENNFKLIFSCIVRIFSHLFSHSPNCYTIVRIRNSSMLFFLSRMKKQYRTVALEFVHCGNINSCRPWVLLTKLHPQYPLASSDRTDEKTFCVCSHKAVYGFNYNRP